MSGRGPMTPLRAVLLLVSATVLLPMAVASTSCSVLGWGIGSALTRNERPRELPAGHALELHPGTRMGVILEDSTLLRGTFMGRIPLAPAVYAARFRDWRKQVGIALALGDQVEVTHRDKHVTRARFAGFAHRAVVLDREDGSGTREVRDADIEWLGLPDSVGWNGAQLAEADARGALPTREAILFRLPPDSAGADWYNSRRWAWASDRWNAPLSNTIPLDEIKAIELEGPRTARTVLMLAGLAVDAVIVASSQPTVAVAGGGCYYQGGSAASVAPGVVPTARIYDTQWGMFTDGGATPEAPPAQALGSSFLPSLPMMPPAPMPSSDHRNNTAPTPAP